MTGGWQAGLLSLTAWTALAQAADTLRLAGTVVLSPGGGAPSHAVFETGDGHQLIVDVGQEVGGCVLVEVRRHRATMDCAHGLVSLGLRSDLRAERASEAPAGDRFLVTLPREAFVLAVNDRQRIAGQISLEPAVRDGWLYGYRVAWIEAGGDFYRLGLREGDVVVSLNGTAASAPGAFMQAVNGLQGQTAFDLTVERRGRRIAYSYLFE